MKYLLLFLVLLSALVACGDETPPNPVTPSASSTLNSTTTPTDPISGVSAVSSTLGHPVGELFMTPGSIPLDLRRHLSCVYNLRPTARMTPWHPLLSWVPGVAAGTLPKTTMVLPMMVYSIRTPPSPTLTLPLPIIPGTTVMAGTILDILLIILTIPTPTSTL